MEIVMSTIRREFGINANCLKNISELDALQSIKEAGFKSVFLESYKNEDVRAIKNKADEIGLTVEFIHAPFSGINNMWFSGFAYLDIFEKMKESIDSASNNDIEGVVVHVSSGWQAPAVNDIGLSRYDELVLYAREKGVKLVFENLRVTGNLAYLVDRYEDQPHVVFCYDCGHEHCYTKTVRWMDIFTTRLFCTHIHDNPGRPTEDKVNDFDYHLLPFDGTCDYVHMMRDLDKYSYSGRLTLEVFQKIKPYDKLTVEEFLSTCYERIEKISEMN